MNIRPVGADLFHANRHAGMTHLTVAFRNFATAPQTYPCDLLNPSNHNGYFANLLFYHSTLCVWPTLYFCVSYESDIKTVISAELLPVGHCNGKTVFSVRWEKKLTPEHRTFCRNWQSSACQAILRI
jgi:hypothetical protein